MSDRCIGCEGLRAEHSKVALALANVSTTNIYAEVGLDSRRQVVGKAKLLLNTNLGSEDWLTNSDTRSWSESL